MKKLLGKNQVIITALAILIAVAGYLNYTEKNAITQTGGKNNETTKEGTVADGTKVDLNAVSAEASKEFSSDDLLNSSEDIVSNDDPNSGLPVNGTGTDEVNGTPSQEVNDAATETTTVNLSANETQNKESVTSEPGEAVFTSASTFSANAKLSREQVRSKNKETLLNALNTGGLSEQQKQQITDEMLKITQVAETENEIETLLSAKGFNDSVVNISDEQAEVVVNVTQVDDVSRAKIEDVVKRKTSFSAQNIIITPITGEN